VTSISAVKPTPPSNMAVSSPFPSARSKELLLGVRPLLILRQEPAEDIGDVPGRPLGVLL
jgi:hypothetical protein